jgi:DNA-binding SARP family transcriptional activator
VGLPLSPFLVVHAGVPQARERIAGLFWPESAGGQALTNLRRELHHLRQVLAEESSLVVTSRERMAACLRCRNLRKLRRHRVEE